VIKKGRTFVPLWREKGKGKQRQMINKNKERKKEEQRLGTKPKKKQRDQMKKNEKMSPFFLFLTPCFLTWDYLGA